MEKKHKIGNSAIEQAIMSIIDPFVSGIADGVDNVIKENEKLKAENARYRKALEIISKEETDSVLPVNLYIAPTNVKRNYMDEAYRLIAREALKGKE